MSITDKEVFKDYYNDTLGQLIEYDKNNDSNILEVLKYYLENKKDMRTAFGCIEYSHGLLDALRMIHGLI